MKKILIILLSIVSLVASLHYSVTLMIFKINQDYIAQNLCVQKDIQNNTCQGCCHLKKQFQTHEEQKSALPENSDRKLVVDFFINKKTSLLPDNSIQKLNYKPYCFAPVSLYEASIFHPPKELYL
nr:hypothetical protein [uncultured Carboxylicivirga sp.]